MLISPAMRNYRSSICDISSQVLRIPCGLRKGMMPSITSISATAAIKSCHIAFFKL